MVSILIIISLITNLAFIFMNRKFGYKKDSYRLRLEMLLK